MTRRKTPVIHGVLAVMAGALGLTAAHAATQAWPWLSWVSYVVAPLAGILPAVPVAFWSEARQRNQALAAGALQ